MSCKSRTIQDKKFQNTVKYEEIFRRLTVLRRKLLHNIVEFLKYYEAKV